MPAAEKRYVILSRILHKRSPFRHGIDPMFFLFMPVGHIATARDLSDEAQTNN